MGIQLLVSWAQTKVDLGFESMKHLQYCCPWLYSDFVHQHVPHEHLTGIHYIIMQKFKIIVSQNVWLLWLLYFLVTIIESEISWDLAYIHIVQFLAPVEFGSWAIDLITSAKKEGPFLFLHISKSCLAVWHWEPVMSVLTFGHTLGHLAIFSNYYCIRPFFEFSNAFKRRR